MKKLTGSTPPDRLFRSSAIAAGPAPVVHVFPAPMTNRIALILFIVLVLGFGILFVAVDDAAVFLGRKLAALIEWIAFWR